MTLKSQPRHKPGRTRRRGVVTDTTYTRCCNVYTDYYLQRTYRSICSVSMSLVKQANVYDVIQTQSPPALNRMECSFEEYQVH